MRGGRGRSDIGGSGLIRSTSGSWRGGLFRSRRRCSLPLGVRLLSRTPSSVVTRALYARSHGDMSTGQNHTSRRVENRWKRERHEAQVGSREFRRESEGMLVYVYVRVRVCAGDTHREKRQGMNE